MKPVLLLLSLFLFLSTPALLNAEVFYPTGYVPGQDIQEMGWGMDFGVTNIDSDYYLTLTPRIETPFLFGIHLGLEIPLEILAYDLEPKTGEKIPSLRKGTYDTKEDYYKTIKYVTYGKHLYFDPGDILNWSIHYGKMTDGYIGHRTIVNRYMSSFDPTVYRPGLMFDINNDLGGIEYFESDMVLHEVIGTRGYIRPIGLLIGVHNLLFTRSNLPSNREVALSIRESRDPDLNGGIFFQEESSGGGSLRQQLLEKIRDAFRPDSGGDGSQEPSTSGGRDGRTSPPESSQRGTGGDKKGADATARDAQAAGSRERGTGSTAQDAESSSGGKAASWSPSYFSRWSIGYTVVRDRNAPLTLEKDGSGNLVVDPEIRRPRGARNESLTVIGMDTEFKMSPFKWLEFTPYVDVNRFKEIDKSYGLHAGLDFDFKMFSLLRIRFRPEYREFTENYIPTYFDTYYSIERTAFQIGGVQDPSSNILNTGQTKLGYAKSLGSGGGLQKGYQGNLVFDFTNLLVLESTYEDYDGPDNSKVFVGLFMPPIFGIFANGYYTKRGFQDFGEAFKNDDRSLAAAEIGMNMLGFTVKATYYRTWIFDDTISKYTANDERTITFGYTGEL